MRARGRLTERLELADGLKSMRDVPDNGFASMAGPAQDKNIEADSYFPKQFSSGQKTQRRPGDLPLLAEVHRGGSLVQSFGAVGGSRADLNDYQCFPIECQEIELARGIGYVRSENAVTKASQETGSRAFAPSPKPPPPPRPVSEAGFANLLTWLRFGGHGLTSSWRPRLPSWPSSFGPTCSCRLRLSLWQRLPVRLWLLLPRLP